MAKSKEQTASELLLKNGTVTLTAKTREDLYEQAQSLTDSLPKDTKWTRTMYEFNAESLDYVQTISIIKK